MWILLLVITILLSILNYQPGTYLSGWDTLHPEFNFGEYFERTIFSVWQEHQGLGAVASQAHAAELPRMLLYYPASFILPDSFLRYFYFFLTLSLGPLGVYFFLKRLNFSPSLSFLGGLFYLLNLVTLQHFYVPLEMFATHYASTPWLFLFAIKFLDSPSKKGLLIFALASFFAAPMAHTSTLWYAYFASFVLFLIVFSLLKGRGVRLTCVKLILITLLVNSFWLLPNIYFVLNHAQEVSSSKIHALFTEEAFAQNASFGTLENLAILKNFLFNWGEYIGNDKFGFLLDEWIKHLENPLVLLLGYVFFAITLMGLAYSVLKKDLIASSMLPVFILSAFFLININFPTGFLFEFIQNNIPNFREAIRFPFTKFSILLLFASTLYFVWGLNVINKFGKNIKYVQILILIIISGSLFYYMSPAFGGNLISKSMKVDFPKEYFSLFKYLEDKPYGRMATFPIHSFWGWTYNNFKDKPYQGAGFLWFGLKQPLLDREFDRWQKYNEQYFREMSQAVYTENPQDFRRTLDKYNVSYILIDKSVLAPGQDPKALFLSETENLLIASPDIRKDKDFGYLSLYTVDKRKNLSNNLFVIRNTKTISPISNSMYEDFAFSKYGPYIAAASSGSSFLFRDLIDNQSRILKEKIKITQEGINLAFGESKDKNLNTANFSSLEKFFAADVVAERKTNSLKITFNPRFPKSDIPITVEPSLPTTDKNFLLSINQKHNFILNNPEENTPLNLGTLLLNTKEENTISIYRDHDDLVIKSDFSTLHFDLKPCQGSVGQGTFGATSKDNNFTISGNYTSACMTIPLKNLLQTQILSPEILFGVSLDSNNPSFCIADLKNGDCKNYDLRNIFLNPASSKRILAFYGIKTSEVSDLGLKFFLENAGYELKKTSYENVIFTFKKPYFHVPFSQEVSEALKSYRIKGNHLLIPFSGNEELSSDITRLPQTAGDCPENLGILATAKKEILKRQFENYIRYSAQEGSFCDHFSYQNLPSDQAYLIVIKSRNIKGLPIRLCVSNRTTGRCDIYAHLSKTSDFSSNVFLLPPMKAGQNGFDVNINNFAVKNIPSINDLASITIIPFPYNWLSQIEEGSSTNRPAPQVFRIRQDQVSHPNKTLYLLDLKERKSGDVLVLSQAFEAGWKAYAGGNSIFPFFGRELKDHVLVSNWANGWVLDNGEGKITIVFLPQYLQYLGFIILLLTFAYLIKAKRYEIRN